MRKTSAIGLSRLSKAIKRTNEDSKIAVVINGQGFLIDEAIAKSIGLLIDGYIEAGEPPPWPATA